MPRGVVKTGGSVAIVAGWRAVDMSITGVSLRGMPRSGGPYPPLLVGPTTRIGDVVLSAASNLCSLLNLCVVRAETYNS